MKKNVVKINLDKERNLYFNLNSLEIIEELTGKPVSEIGNELSMKMLKAIVFAGLVHEDKELTVDAVGEMIGFEQIEEVSEAIGKAFGDLK